MLRISLLVIGALALVSAWAAALCGAPFPLILWLGVAGLGLIGGILLERGRYKPAAPGHPGRGWVATGERFVDPENGKTIAVYYKPSTGERLYVG